MEVASFGIEFLFFLVFAEVAEATGLRSPSVTIIWNQTRGLPVNATAAQLREIGYEAIILH